MRGLKIGILTEGFQLPNMDPLVETKVRDAIARLQARAPLLAKFPCRNTIWRALFGRLSAAKV